MPLAVTAAAPTRHGNGVRDRAAGRSASPAAVVAEHVRHERSSSRFVVPFRRRNRRSSAATSNPSSAAGYASRSRPPSSADVLHGRVVVDGVEAVVLEAVPESPSVQTASGMNSQFMLVESSRMKYTLGGTDFVSPETSGSVREIHGEPRRRARAEAGEHRERRDGAPESFHFMASPSPFRSRPAPGRSAPYCAVRRCGW